MDRYEVKLEQIQGLVTEVKKAVERQAVDHEERLQTLERSAAAAASDRPLVVIARRSAHEVAWWAYSIIGGISLLFIPSSVTAVMGQWQLFGWALMFVMSGVFGLWAMFDRRHLGRSLSFEQGAWLVNAAALLTFAAVIVSLVPFQRAWFTLGMCAIWITANLYRALWQIRQEFNSLNWGAGDG